LLKSLNLNSLNKISAVIFIIVTTLFLLFNTSLNFSASEKNTNTQILSPAISYVNKYYIDKSKIEPTVMLEEGLSKLEQIIDEVLIEFPENQKSKNFIVQVMDNKKSFNFSNIKDIQDLTEIFDEVFGYIGDITVSCPSLIPITIPSPPKLPSVSIINSLYILGVIIPEFESRVFKIAFTTAYSISKYVLSSGR